PRLRLGLHALDAFLVGARCRGFSFRPCALNRLLARHGCFLLRLVECATHRVGLCSRLFDGPIARERRLALYPFELTPRRLGLLAHARELLFEASRGFPACLLDSSHPRCVGIAAHAL